MKTWIALVVALVAGLLGSRGAWGQQGQPAPIALGGVAITPEGLVEMGRTTAPPRRGGMAGLTYISLARLGEHLRGAVLRQEVPSRELRYLQGLTRIEYVFVFPGERDIVLAGPSEPIQDANPLQATGAISGRPLLQLDDLVVALRAVHGTSERTVFGCSLDLAPNAQQIADEVARRFSNASRARLAAELQAALGPQHVRVLGVAADSRVALAMVTADYRLKRMAMGLDTQPGVGHALSSGLAANRVWFEPAYEPMGVTADGLSYRIAGPRLKVLAGAQEFDEKGATPAAAAFARRLSAEMETVAGRLGAFADLQNVTDLFLVATLIRYDGLARKAGLDLSWLLAVDGAGAGAAAPRPYVPAALVVPRVARTLVHDTGTMIVQGGVSLAARRLREVERKGGETALAEPARRPDEGWHLTVARGSSG